MARVQITVSDEDRDRFVQQAQSEGLSLSAWLRLAAYERLGERKPSPLFNSTEELEAFFDMRDTLEGPALEPEWEEHLEVICESRRKMLDPRDLCHLASCRRRDVREIKTFDNAFDAVAATLR